MNVKHTILEIILALFIGVMLFAFTNKDIEQVTTDIKVEERLSTVAGVSTVLYKDMDLYAEEETKKPERKIDIYADGFRYYEIPDKYKETGGELPEVVQIYLWNMCKERELDYYMVLALIERESKYKKDSVGDSGNSLGYMQVQQRWHSERMKEEQVTNLLDAYGNIRVATNFLQELYRDYGSKGDDAVLMVYNMGAGRAKELWGEGVYSSNYSNYILSRAQEIKQELTQE